MPAIRFLDVDSFTKGLTPTTSTEFFTRTGEFHTEGLFSETIFGAVGSLERSQIFSFVDLHSTVIHPQALKLMIRLDRKVEKFVSTEENFVLDADGRLEINEEGVTGITEFINMFPKIKWKGETATRDRFIVLLKDAYKKKTVFISSLPVVPPDHRPIYQDENGVWVYDQLNNIYLTVMRRASQVQTATGGALFDLLNHGLQMAVIEHDKYVMAKVEKKRGLVREQLMGKRVDFSGRAVITPGPDLKINEIGVPFPLAVSLFEPFLIHKLLYSGSVGKDELEKEVKAFTELDLSVDSIQRVIRSIKSEDVIPAGLHKIFWDATENSMRGRVVIAKRDPVLHAESVRAFYPILVGGITIQLCTLQVGGFNADFDGDQMALFHPVTNEAQDEARTKMMRAKSGNTPTITFEISKEMAAGLYMLTKTVVLKKSPIAVSEEDLQSATDPYIPVTYRRQTTTMGKAIVNSCFPSTFPFVDEQLTKRKVNSLLRTLVNKIGDEIAQETASKLEKYGFKFATLLAPSFTLDDIEIPDTIYQLKTKLKDSSTEEAVDILAKMQELLIKHLKDTGVYILVESGSTKGWNQPMQILVAKGIIADPQGNILPAIAGSFSEGLDNKEFFEAASGARKGIIDRTLNTADTGYTSRKLVYVLNSVEASHTLKDCRTTGVLNITLNKDLIGRFAGRWIVKNNKLEEFDPKSVKPGDIVQMRSPVFCKSSKICHTCYGRLLERHRTPYVGVMAAQTIGEIGTQFIMRTFHTGGAVSLEKRNILTEIAENDPMVSESKLTKYLDQIESRLACKGPCKVLIDMGNYDVDGNIRIDENNIWVSSLICRVEFADFMFNIILDYPVDLQVQEMNKIDKDYIELTYAKDSILFEVPLEKTEMKEQVKYVERLLGGKEVYRDADHLYKKLYKVYAPIAGDIDSVHLEILLSQALRDKKNPNQPARLGSTWDPTMMSIKNIVFSSGFIQGVAFEQLGKAIQTGLIEDGPAEPSILERVLTGTLVPKEGE